MKIYEILNFVLALRQELANLRSDKQNFFPTDTNNIWKYRRICSRRLLRFCQISTKRSPFHFWRSFYSSGDQNEQIKKNNDK